MTWQRPLRLQNDAQWSLVSDDICHAIPHPFLNYGRALENIFMSETCLINLLANH